MSRPSAPTVSVVLPAYQSVRFIRDTVTSILAQTFDDFELVVSDHMSTDGTWEALQEFSGDPRVRLMRTPTGGGAQRNWNAVSDEARGRYLKLVCGDDLVYPGALTEQVAALEAHPSAAVAASPRDLIDVHGGVLLAARGMSGLDGLVPGRQAIRAVVRAGTNLFGEPGCVLLRTDRFREVGGWANDFPYLIDQFTYMRVLEGSDLVGLSTPQAAFRLNNAQWSVRLATEQGAAAGGVHKYYRALMPDVVSTLDERVGTARAYRTAWARRAAYVVWRKRMGDVA